MKAGGRQVGSLGVGVDQWLCSRLSDGGETLGGAGPGYKPLRKNNRHSDGSKNNLWVIAIARVDLPQAKNTTFR